MSKVSFEMAVGVYGTDRLSIQCYLLHRAADVYSIADSLDNSWSRFGLTDECSTERVLLLEKDVTCFTDFASEAIGILTWSSRQSAVCLAVLIFDGGYGGPDRLLSEEILDQVYGVWVSSFGPVLTLDREVMKSSEWQNLLRRARQLSHSTLGTTSRARPSET
jgi:hypothetical protein